MASSTEPTLAVALRRALPEVPRNLDRFWRGIEADREDVLAFLASDAFRDWIAERLDETNHIRPEFNAYRANLMLGRPYDEEPEHPDLDAGDDSAIPWSERTGFYSEA